MQSCLNKVRRILTRSIQYNLSSVIHATVPLAQSDTCGVGVIVTEMQNVQRTANVLESCSDQVRGQRETMDATIPTGLTPSATHIYCFICSCSCYWSVWCCCCGCCCCSMLMWSRNKVLLLHNPKSTLYPFKRGNRAGLKMPSFLLLFETESAQSSKS